MASQSAPAPVSSATASTFPSSQSESATIPATTSAGSTSLSTIIEPIRPKSLKRARPDSAVVSVTNTDLSPTLKSPRYKGAFIPAPLTGVAAMEDKRRKQEEVAKTESSATSENPSLKALSSLMAGGGLEMSRRQDGPPRTTAMSEGMSIVANAITIPGPAQVAIMQASPTSVTSLTSLSTTAQTVTASPTVMSSPAEIASIPNEEDKAVSPQHGLAELGDEPSNRAFSYPGNRNLPGQQDSLRAPPRGLSLPMPIQNQQLAPRSPSQKKHKCPYCETEFTRHHNLKSHLLTHSQEKPYVCQSCQMRFRRLHDLKRHMKLHTGERPHICPKCDRKFARGDALARHSKGQGGCAGRRASMGSFGGDDEFDESNTGENDTGMEGVMYSNGAQPGGPETTEENRRFSLPSIKAQHVGKGSQDNYARPPSTYPPSGPRPGQSSPHDIRRDSLYPPNSERGASGSSVTSPTSGSLSMALSTSGGSMFAQSGMTESPKPLSPAGMHAHQLGHDINRARSPSLATQFQQQNFGRHQSERASPNGMALPSPLGTQGPRLPSLPGLAPPEQKYTLSSQAPTTQQTPTSGGASAANSPNTAYQQRSYPPGYPQDGGSGDSSNNLFAGGDSGVLAYVKTLENRVEQMTSDINAMQGREKAAHEQIASQQEHIKRLNEEVMFLRNQLGQGQPPPS